MNIVIEGFTTENDALLKESYKIRHTVFVSEQNVEKTIEYDGLDSESTHYLLFVNQKPAATMRWRETPKGIKLERLATLKEFRGKALGSVLLRFVMNEILPSKQRIYMHSQIDVVSFYEFHGFKRVGEQFTEAAIEHFEMEYSPKKIKI